MIRLDEEQEPQQERRMRHLDDKIDEALLKSRRLFLCEPVDMNSAKDMIRKLWYLELEQPGKPILFVINSPGGSVDAGFAIWDQVNMISSPVTTLVTGLAASMGSILSLCAAPKKRFATPHARFMIHQPSIGGLIRGQATDLAIQAKEIIKTRSMLIDLYVKKTGRDTAAVAKALDRDTWMSAQEAVDFGLLDGIANSFQELTR